MSILPANLAQDPLAAGLHYMHWGRVSRAAVSLRQAWEQGAPCQESLCEALTLLRRWPSALEVAASTGAGRAPDLRAEILLDAALRAPAGTAMAAAWRQLPRPPPDGDAWLCALHALASGEEQAVLQAFTRGAARHHRWWSRCAMGLGLALHALERHPREHAHQAVAAYLALFDEGPRVHPGRVKADRLLVLLWLNRVCGTPIPAQRRAALDHEIDELLQQDIGILHSERAVLLLARRALDALQFGHPALQDELAQALAEDREGCPVKRAFLQPAHLRLAQAGMMMRARACS